MTKYLRIAFILIYLSTLPLWVRGQDIFDTKNAEIVLKVRHHGVVSDIWSNQLHILLDLSNANFSSYLEKGSIQTRDDLLLKDLESLPQRIELNGNFGTVEIQTTTHVPLIFPLVGKLSVGSTIIPVNGMAKLQHIDGGDIACLLSFEFTLSKEVLPLDMVKRHRVEEIEIRVLQSILNPRLN